MPLWFSSYFSLRSFEEQSREAAGEFFRSDGLGEVNIRAVVYFLNIVCALEAAENNDGQAREFRVMAEEAAQLVAIQVRHDRIGHDGIHCGSQHGFHRLKAIGGDSQTAAA